MMNTTTVKANKVTATSTRKGHSLRKLLGYSTSSVLVRMGRARWTFDQAAAVLKKHHVKASPATIRTSLRAESYRIAAPLTGAELVALRRSLLAN